MRRLADITGAPDVARPNAARMYDYFLGGDANFEMDRDAAERQMRISRLVAPVARANRAFLGRAVRSLVERGISQFLDLGSGIPTVGNVHEIAHSHNPDAQVAYVDHEPVAVAHGRMLLGDDRRVTVSQADLTRPTEVLSAHGVRGLLDFTRPVAVLIVSVLHFVSDEEDPAEVVAGYRDACAPGSALAISHISPTSVTPDQIEASRANYARTSTPLTVRGKAEIGALFDGYELVEPGLVPLPAWHPDADLVPTPAHTRDANSYAAVGLLP